MTLAILVLVALIVIGFVRFRAKENQEAQNESSQVTEETPSPNFDTSYFHEEIISSPEPEESPAGDQGEAIPEPRPKRSSPPKKSSTKSTTAKKSTGKKTTTKKSTPKK
jgi:cytoskeletal protein RodZ